jgi:hypothetical protein
MSRVDPLLAQKIPSRPPWHEAKPKKLRFSFKHVRQMFPALSEAGCSQTVVVVRPQDLRSKAFASLQLFTLVGNPC